MTTLTNSFHNTEARTRLTLPELEKLAEVAQTGFGGDQQAARRTIRRIRNKLCGITGCTCGDTFGVRN